MEQILDQSERAEPSAHKPADQCAYKHQKSCHIKRQFKIPAPDDSLHSPDRTCPESSRTGITIQAGDAKIFQLPLINLPLRKPQQIAVGKQRPKRLNPMAFPCRLLSNSNTLQTYVNRLFQHYRRFPPVNPEPHHSKPGRRQQKPHPGRAQ